MLLDAGDEIYQQATVRNRPGEKEDDDVKMISAVQQVDIINDVSIVQCCDGHSQIVMIGGRIAPPSPPVMQHSSLHLLSNFINDVTSTEVTVTAQQLHICAYSAFSRL